MVDVLETKRAATRFRILVEIADRQPAVSQGEIADAVGVTSQAVSEYIRELVSDGYVEMEGRSRYRVTIEGVDWLLQAAADVRRFADHVTEDVLGGFQVDAAIAADDLSAGEAVSLRLVDGLLTADPEADGPATGQTTGAASAGQDVGITGFEGVIDLEPGAVQVVQIPSVRSGGSRVIDPDRLAEMCLSADLVACAGVEAVVAVRSTELAPDTWFAPGSVAADAAGLGLEVTVVATVDHIGRVTDALSDANVGYAVSDIT